MRVAGGSDGFVWSLIGCYGALGGSRTSSSRVQSEMDDARGRGQVRSGNGVSEGDGERASGCDSQHACRRWTTRTQQRTSTSLSRE